VAGIRGPARLPFPLHCTAPAPAMLAPR
jgi:hypothetical protein